MYKTLKNNTLHTVNLRGFSFFLLTDRFGLVADCAFCNAVRDDALSALARRKSSPCFKIQLYN